MRFQQSLLNDIGCIKLVRKMSSNCSRASIIKYGRKRSKSNRTASRSSSILTLGRDVIVVAFRVSVRVGRIVGRQRIVGIVLVWRRLRKSVLRRKLLEPMGFNVTVPEFVSSEINIAAFVAGCACGLCFVLAEPELDWPGIALGDWSEAGGFFVLLGVDSGLAGFANRPEASCQNLYRLPTSGSPPKYASASGSIPLTSS